MHDILNRIAAALALAVVLLVPAVVTAQEVFADDPDGPGRHDPDSRWPDTSFRAWAESRPDGVHLGITKRDVTPGVYRPPGPAWGEPAQQPVAWHPPSNSSRPGEAAPQGRTWTDALGIVHHETPDGQVISVIPPPRIIGWAPLTTWEGMQRDHPGENPFIINVDDRFAGVIWVPGGAPNNFVFDPAAPPPANLAAPDPGVNIDLLEVVREILGFVPLPAIEVRMNPPLGLVALTSWYWVEGYDGRPFGGSKTIGEGMGAVTIEVRVWPSKYEWSFGDGATQVTQSLGQRYPAESEIKHTYEYSSFRFEDGFPVRLTVTFEAEYRVNDGPWQRLTPIRQTYGTDYPVQELQTVLRKP